MGNTTDTENTGIIHENTREVPTTTDEMIEVHLDHRTAHMHLLLLGIVVTTLLVTTVRVLTDRVIHTQGQVPHRPQTTTKSSKKVQMVMSAVLTGQVQLQALLLPQHTHQVHAID